MDEGARSLLIAPLTLQMLVENAVKHNVASIASPLRVDIYVENGRSLIVRNNLRRKQTVEGSTGTGLANIKLRYAYLSDREVDVIERASTSWWPCPCWKWPCIPKPFAPDAAARAHHRGRGPRLPPPQRAAPGAPS